ncbi:AAA family ATPase [Pseudalkalibacillus berkeleyi]|uniref:ATP-binding protein n=1 Tax=Pseudalkalibacillus berkeleyi TaxID=1069813 RepID=A0ABS9H310_9BACL|nr:AAA family ATPase [Pseudalkalibacillus berkeleyi]MCF6138496.1 ATP-binding protein [Pseudalkalibacillus berkeleyi]
MRRLVIITVGKTHSGKSTFAKALEQQLQNALVVDQDNHAEFINTFYKHLLPKQGPNTIKYALTQTIIDYAVDQTNVHLILCNSNRGRTTRLNLLDHFHKNGFTSILVDFDIPDHVLQERIANSERSTAIFRSASTFEEVLIKQQKETSKKEITSPIEGEANHLFVIKTTDDIPSVTKSILDIANQV